MQTRLLIGFRLIFSTLIYVSKLLKLVLMVLNTNNINCFVFFFNNISSFFLSGKVPLLREKELPVIGVGKHLCGAATGRLEFSKLHKCHHGISTARLM